MKYLSFESPVVLCFTLIASSEFILNVSTGGAFQAVMFSPTLQDLFSFSGWTSSFIYVFGHIGLNHFAGNMTLFLLLGTTLEEKYGSKTFVFMLFSAAVLTSVANAIFCAKYVVQGASGLVFMMVALSSFTSIRPGKIPLTCVLIVLLFTAKEIASIFEPTSVAISHFSHFFGGGIGILFGFIFAKKKEM